MISVPNKNSMTTFAQSRRRMPAAIRLAFIVAALASSRLVAEEYPSEAWTPYPSESWSPRLASLPAQSETLPLPPGEGRGEGESPSSNTPPSALPTPHSPFPTPTSAVFAPPPIAGDAWEERGVMDAGPSYNCPPPCDAWHVQSYFMPSLCRYGLIAPRTPGVDSVHGAYTAAPPCGPPSPYASIFGPPPCTDCNQCESGSSGGWGRAEGEPPVQMGGRCAPPQPPCIDGRAQLSPYSTGDFSPDPFCDQPYDTCAELGVYGDKYLNPTQRPLVEWGFPLYDTGPVPPPSLDCGPTNPSLPRFYIYGDYRAAAAYNDQNANAQGVVANRLNLEWDLWLTSTERFHMFTGPLQRGNDFQRVEFDNGGSEFFNELDFFNADTDTAFFEGDLGYMLGGWTGKYAQFDMPVTVGLIPLLFQNGVWMEDAIVGVAATIPARNNPTLDWSNYDITFFAGFDQVTSPAFENSQAAANVFGVITMIESKGGYIELGYAFLDDTANQGRSYNNVGISYTRRYLNLLSNSMRVIVNSGQNGPTDDRTANGVLLIAENSFLTRWPYNVIPYINLWSGFDDPQSVARAGAAGGVLRNTGILFESDNLTGFPTLDATAANTYGAAFGIDLLSPEFTHQLIVEFATVQVFGDPALRNAPGNQYGIGARYQVPISNATLLRFDVMHGLFDDAPDVSGARAEFRWKF